MTATDTADIETDQEQKKAGKLGVILIAFVALLGGGGGFYLSFSGVLSSVMASKDTEKAPSPKTNAKASKSTYLAMDPVIVSIRGSRNYKHLRFQSYLDTDEQHRAEVERLMPRITDVMNMYLNALEAGDFEDPIAMIKLRSQLLRRVQIVTGKTHVNDLLIKEFVLQ